MYRNITHLFSKPVREKFRRLVVYSDIDLEADRLMGFILFFGLGLALALAFYFNLLFQLSGWIMFLVSFVVFEIAAFFWIISKADKKAKLIENYLPDALLLLSSNLKSGLTTDRALIASARPDFGPLQKEIESVSRELSAGKNLSKALLGMTFRVKSEKLKKTVNLIVSGIKSGGKLADLLEQSAKNLRTQDFIKKKIEANVLMYVIFIFIAVGIGAPFLFGLSSVLIEIISENLAKVQVPEVVGLSLPLKITGVAISASFVIKFVIFSLSVTAIFGSLILGLISKGEEKQGIKTIPFLLGLALAIFFLVRFGVSSLFSGLVVF